MPFICYCKEQLNYKRKMYTYLQCSLVRSQKLDIVQFDSFLGSQVTYFYCFYAILLSTCSFMGDIMARTNFYLGRSILNCLIQFFIISSYALVP